MTAKKGKLGDVVEISEGGEVVRPDGSVSVVRYGRYVLDVPGTFIVDGTEVNVS